MIIDVHAHIWKNKYEADRQDLLKAVEVHNIKKIIISALGCYIPGEDEIRELNSEAEKTLKTYPDIFEGYVYVNPRNADAMDVLRRGIEEQGFIGMKLWVATYCDDRLCYPLYEQCIKYDIPVLIHSFYKAVDQLPYESLGQNVANVAKRYPEAKILMAHLGADCYNGIKPIAPYKNVSVDISGSIYRADDLNYTIRQIGADRILFGTDMGASFNMSYGQILEADCSEADREKMLSGNAIKLFGLKL